MAKKKSNIFSTIIKIFIFMTIMDALFSGLIFDPFYFGLFGLAEWLVGLVIGGVVLIGLIILIIGLLSGRKDNEKAKRYASVSVNDFLSNLAQQAKEDNRLQIDDETFLFFTDRENITLDNVDVYMRNEYVGTLSEYDSAFPNAFNNFMGSMMDKMSKRAKKKASKKKKEEKSAVIETIEQIKPVEKDCAYYIDRFRQLDGEIENEQVKGHIRSTIEYLEQIKHIEDEFGESKDKTKKLYQYYLPMYVDILANYDRLADNAPASEEFKENEAKLMKTSAMINSAMQTLTSSLVERYYTDLNVDMKTLESILKKDGLVRDIDNAKEAGRNE